jgi:chaperonin GroES
MTDKIKPLSNRVVVRPKEAEEKTQGGIFMPTQSDEKLVHAEVVTVGVGKMVEGKLEPVSLEKGQVVVFNQFSGTEVEYNGEKYMIVREDDVLAVIA